MSDGKLDFRLENFDEYDEPCQMTSQFCRQMSVEEYEEQSANATEMAIMDLLNYLDKNPQKIQSILTKRKKEELEGLGIFSYLKMKLTSLFTGDKNYGVKVADEECQNKLDDLKCEMTKVLDYSLKAKGRRCSSRLAAKRQKMSAAFNDENDPNNAGVLHPPPPPPPPPPLPSSVSIATPGGTEVRMGNKRKGTPLKDINFKMDTPKSLVKPKRKHERIGSDFSISSLSTIGSFGSLQQELLSSNPLQRLRATNNERSPGGTPCRKRHCQGENPANLSGCEPLYSAFVKSMQYKFRNVRSPSPADHRSNVSSPGDVLSPSGFTP